MKLCEDMNEITLVILKHVKDVISIMNCTVDDG